MFKYHDIYYYVVSNPGYRYTIHVNVAQNFFYEKIRAYYTHMFNII